MIEIVLDRNEVQQCRDYHEKVMSRRKIRRTPNYTGLECRDRFFDGACGELAFKKFLDQNGKWYQHTSNDRGVSDDQDFIVSIDGCRRSLNVKHSNHPRARYLLFNEDQVRRKTPEDFLVGSSGRWDCSILIVSIHGIESAANFIRSAERVIYQTPVLRKKLSALYPIEKAIERFI
jgi:hypothetical protein